MSQSANDKPVRSRLFVVEMDELEDENSYNIGDTVTATYRGIVDGKHIWDFAARPPIIPTQKVRLKKDTEGCIVVTVFDYDGVPGDEKKLRAFAINQDVVSVTKVSETDCEVTLKALDVGETLINLTVECATGIGQGVIRVTVVE